MFETGYKCSLIDKKLHGKEDFLQEIWRYNFTTDANRRYIINVEVYRGHIYIIKYHAASHSKSQNKYSFILNDGNPNKIIRTCIDVMLEFYKLNSDASFGFIGAHSVNKIRKGKKIVEPKANCQRFRIYQTIMFNFFGKKTFSHFRNKDLSVYLMINRKNDPIEKFKEHAEKMFTTLYPHLDFTADAETGS